MLLACLQVSALAVARALLGMLERVSADADMAEDEPDAAAEHPAHAQIKEVLEAALEELSDRLHEITQDEVGSALARGLAAARVAALPTFLERLRGLHYKTLDVVNHGMGRSCGRGKALPG